MILYYVHIVALSEAAFHILCSMSNTGPTLKIQSETLAQETTARNASAIKERPSCTSYHYISSVDNLNYCLNCDKSMIIGIHVLYYM